MAEFSFNPITQYLTLTYKCPECGELTTSDSLAVPSPNYLAEKARDSENSEDYEISCQNCGSASQVSLYTRYDGGWGEVEGIESDTLTVDEYIDNEFDFEDFEFNEDEFIRTGNEYEKILGKLDNLSQSERNTIHQLLYVNIIARMEAFLSDILKSEVLRTDENKRKFTETFKDFENVQLNLTELYCHLDKHESTIREALNDLIYHNIGKIKPIYKDAIGIDLGDIADLAKAVQKRHHIVHRDGKDKEGNKITITEQDVKDLWEKVRTLMGEVTEQLFLKRFPDFGDKDVEELEKQLN